MKQIECELFEVGGKTIIRRRDTRSEIVWNRREKSVIGVADFLRATEVGSSDFVRRPGCDRYRVLILTPDGVDSSWWKRWPQVKSFFSYQEPVLAAEPESPCRQWNEPLFKPTRKSPEIPSAPLMSSGPHSEDDTDKEDDGVVRLTGVMIFGHKTGASIQINKDPRLTKYMLGRRDVVDHIGVTKLSGAVVNVVGNTNAKGESDDPDFVNRKRKEKS